MKMITLIIFGVLCLGMDLLYTMFNKTKGYKALLIKGLTVLASFVLAVMCANLNSLTSALPLFIFVGLGFCLLSEAMSVSTVDQEKPKMLVSGILRAVAFSFFAVSSFALSGFNFYLLVGGALAGFGVGFIVCAIKKYNKFYQVFSTILAWPAIGLILSSSIFAYLNSIRYFSSLLMVCAGALLLLSQLIKTLAKEESKWQYLASMFYTFAITIFAVLIYFY